MEQLDVLMKWWADPESVLIPAGQTNQIIDWLKQQTPDTWHQVVMSWNYDHGDQVISWILNQEKCDRGTAAQVFMVEGVGHWLWDAIDDAKALKDSSHVCNIVLKNWNSYKTGDLEHEHKVPEKLAGMVRDKGDKGHFAGTPLKEIMSYQGKRQANSKFGSEDGKIVVALDHWAKSKGIEIDGM